MNLLAVALCFALRTSPAGPASLRVVLDPPPAQDVELLAGIARDDDDPDWVTRRHITAPAKPVTIDGLAAGRYVVLVRGYGPLERADSRVNLGSGDHRSITIPIVPRTVHLQVTRGGAPLASAMLTFFRRDGRWDMTVPVRQDGTATAVAWSSGEFDVTVNGGGLRAPYSTFRNLADELAVDIPNRAIRGRVEDDRGDAVPDADLTLRHETETSRRLIPGSVASDGAFEFAGLEPGHYSILVSAPGHLRPAPISVQVGAEEGAHDVAVVVPLGELRDVSVFDAHGPLPDATLVCAVGGQVRSVVHTDRSGGARLPIPSGESGTVFSFSSEGSIAVAHFGPASNGEVERALRISVSPPTASLEIAARTTAGVPVPGVTFLLRINGELVPPAVAHELEVELGATLTTGPDGIARLPHVPTGSYELWPYSNEDEAQAILESAGAMAAPVVINVATGANRATIRFQSRQ